VEQGEELDHEHQQQGVEEQRQQRLHEYAMLAEGTNKQKAEAGGGGGLWLGDERGKESNQQRRQRRHTLLFHPS